MSTSVRYFVVVLAKVILTFVLCFIFVSVLRYTLYRHMLQWFVDIQKDVVSVILAVISVLLGLVPCSGILEWICGIFWPLVQNLLNNAKWTVLQYCYWYLIFDRPFTTFTVDKQLDFIGNLFTINVLEFSHIVIVIIKSLIKRLRVCNRHKDTQAK